jgi:hypothetical protein
MRKGYILTARRTEDGVRLDGMNVGGAAVNVVHEIGPYEVIRCAGHKYWADRMSGYVYGAGWYWLVKRLDDRRVEVIECRDSSHKWRATLKELSLMADDLAKPTK